MSNGPASIARTRWWLAALLCSVALASGASSDSADSAAAGSVLVMQIDGMISPATTDFVRRGLAKAQAGSASAVFSMLRNLGGAVGTALLAQLVVVRERVHSARIGEAVTLFDPVLQQRLPLATSPHCGRITRSSGRKPYGRFSCRRPDGPTRCLPTSRRSHRRRTSESSSDATAMVCRTWSGHGAVPRTP